MVFCTFENHLKELRYRKERKIIKLGSSHHLHYRSSPKHIEKLANSGLNLLSDLGKRKALALLVTPLDGG